MGKRPILRLPLHPGFNGFELLVRLCISGSCSSYFFLAHSNSGRSCSSKYLHVNKF
jgi:hypothetical protein